MKVIAITQARYGSSRLPGKVLKTINGKKLLQIHLERAAKAKKIDKLIVATTIEKEAIEIVSIAEQLRLTAYRGSINDVLDRYYQAAKNELADYVVRITSDCPLIDPRLMDKIIEICIVGNYDYCSNTIHPTYPDGTDVEIFKFSALEKAWKEAIATSDREHVTPYIWRNSTAKGGTHFTSFNIKSDTDYSEYRLTVDENKDFELIEILVSEIGENKSWEEYVNFLHKNPAIFNINASIKRNEGYTER